MGVTQRQTQQLQPRRLREWVPGSSLLQTSNFSFLQLPNSKTNQPVKMAMSKIRQNYHEDCEALINKQINMEFYASYVYLSMSSFFNRDDQALHGFAEHFKKESNEERGHGMKLMEYQTKRGGRVVFQDIAKPTTMDWGSPLEAMEAALELEKTVNQSLLDIHKVAGDKGDGHLCDFLESEYLSEQVEGIKAVGDLITKMKRAGDGLGLHIIDKEMGSQFSKTCNTKPQLAAIRLTDWI